MICCCDRFNTVTCPFQHFLHSASVLDFSECLGVFVFFQLFTFVSIQSEKEKKQNKLKQQLKNKQTKENTGISSVSAEGSITPFSHFKILKEDPEQTNGAFQSPRGPR